MVEIPGAALALGPAAFLAAKVLGPTFDYLGGELADWTERRRNNLGRVFGYAGRKLGPDLETDGVVPPRVLKGVLEEGQFADSELTAEY